MLLQGPDLSLNSQGEEVRLLHRELAQLGFQIPPTETIRGSFGPGTEAAVKQFQERHRLEPTGVVDETTARLLTAQIQSLDKYKVRGQVLSAEGQPLAGAIVRAFDKDLRHEEMLGEVKTDAEGRFEITYTRAQFRRVGKKQADLIVRVYDAAEALLGASPLIFKAQSVATVDLKVGEPPAPMSEYDQLVASLTPLLNGTQIGDLTGEDLAFLVGESGLDSQQLALLVLSHRQAKESGLPPAALYGCFRQDLPASLKPLLTFPQKAWRQALEAALAENLIPADLGKDLDGILERMRKLAAGAEPGSGSAPLRRLPRLDIRLLRRGLLDNLKPEDGHKDFINENLNEELRRVVAEMLAEQDHGPLAAFVRVMDSVDLAAEADISLRAFVEDRVEQALSKDSAMAPILLESVQALSDTTTLGQVLDLDQAIQDHPLFQIEANRLKSRALLDTSPLLANRQLQDAFIDRYAGHQGTLEEFWQKLRQDQAFQTEGLVEDIQFTLQLSWLTEHNIPLVQALRQNEKYKDITSERQLTRLSETDWQELILAAKDGDTVAIPEGIPGESEEEKIKNYADNILSALEIAYPMDYVWQGVAQAPDLDLGVARQVAARVEIPSSNFETRQFLKGDVDLPGVSPEKVKQTLEKLRREINTYPDVDFRRMLTEGQEAEVPFSQPLRDNLVRFFDNAPDFDFRTTRVDAYLKEHADKAFDRIAKEDRIAVTAQLKRLQRVFQVAPRYRQMEALLGEGLDSAYRIVTVPQKTFVNLMAGKLGGEAAAYTAYRQSMQVAANTQTLFYSMYQAFHLDVPFVLGGGNPKRKKDNRQAANKIKPTWETLFGSLELCDCEHCQSVYGPSAYFVDLLQFISNGPLDVLLQRRPDLTHIKLTCDNAMTPMPYVDLVNEILEYYVGYGKLRKSTARNTEKITPEELSVNPQHTIELAYDKLKAISSATPHHLPFNRDVEVSRVYLEHLGSSRHQVMEVFQTSGTSDEDVAAEDLKISPEEYQILIGGVPAGTRLFEPPMEDVLEVIRYLGIPYTDLLELLKTRFVNSDPDPNKTVVLDAPADKPCDLSVTHLQYADGSELDDKIWLKLVRFVKLWRKLDWSIAELDKTFSALKATDITSTFLKQLAQVKRLHDELDLPVVKLLSFWANIDTHGEHAFYNQLFLNKTVMNPAIKEFRLNPDGTELEFFETSSLEDKPQITAHLPALAAAAMVRTSDLEKVRLHLGVKYLNLNDISESYRYPVLAKALGLSMADLLSLITLANLEPFESPEATLKFVEMVRKVQDSNFSVAQLNYLFRHLEEPVGRFSPPREVLLGLTRTLRDGLNQISTETKVVEDPQGEVTRATLAALFDQELAERAVQMVLDTGAVYPSHLSLSRPPEVTFHDDFNIPQELRKRITYDPVAEELCFAGLMTEDEQILLLDNAPPLTNDHLQYRNAVGKLYQQAQDFRSSSTDFITSSLGGLLNPEETTVEVLDNTSIDPDTGKPDTRLIALKFKYLLEKFLPFLREQLKRSLVKQTLGQALQLDGDMVAYLLETLLQSSQHAGKPAIEDVLALETKGLDVGFYTERDEVGRRRSHLISKGIIFGRESDSGRTVKPSVPENAQKALIRGILLAPNNGEYTFLVQLEEVKGKRRLWLGDNPKPIDFKKPVFLKAGEFYDLRLELTEIERSQIGPLPQISQSIFEILWQSKTTPLETLPSDQLLPAAIFESFAETFTLLHKIAMVINGFELTVPETPYFSEHKEDFAEFDLRALPLDRANPENVDEKAKQSFRWWPRLYDYTDLRDSLPRRELGLIEVFRFAASGADPQGLGDAAVKQLALAANQDLESFRWSLPTLAKKQALNLLLAACTGWEAEEVANLTGDQGLALAEDHFKNEVALVRLQACLRLVKRLGVSAAILFRWAQTTLTEAETREIRNITKAKYDEEMWPTIGKPLNDALRERQKAALIDYILASDEMKAWKISDSNQLFEYFLIDVNMSPCMLTSRLKQAIASVQLFIQRCLMNLESGVSPKAIEAIDEEQWEWRKRYRLWEANRKIFLYPENWIEPELRDDKTPFFKELETELLQGDLTPEYVEKVFLHYLEKLDEVARLEICGIYWEAEQDGRDWRDGILHVFGRTLAIPRAYLFLPNLGAAHCDLDPWEKVTLSIDESQDGGVHLIPVVFNRRLYLFWPIFTEKPLRGPTFGEGEPALTVGKFNWPGVNTGRSAGRPKQVSQKKILSLPMVCCDPTIETPPTTDDSNEKELEELPKREEDTEKTTSYDPNNENKSTIITTVTTRYVKKYTKIERENIKKVTWFFLPSSSNHFFFYQ
jgi:hypothetical protein